jgi:tRNA A37 methylthiotransferase MiaB
VTKKTVNATGVEVILKLAEAGMQSINMGIQSGSYRILQQVYNHYNTPDECRNAINIIHKATRHLAVEILYDVITYNPEETKKDILETIHLIQSIPFNGCQTARTSTHKLSHNT